MDWSASKSLVLSSFAFANWTEDNVVSVEEEGDKLEGSLGVDWLDDDVRTTLLLLLFRREFNKFIWAELLVDFLIRWVVDGLEIGRDGDAVSWDVFKLFNKSHIGLLLLVSVIRLLELELELSIFDLVIKDVNEEISNRFEELEVVVLELEVVEVVDAVADVLLVWLTLVNN